jgi:prephenate dehydratase/chorismate mutase/prephenate dehydratase
MDLKDIRRKIDAIDFEILKLLNSRMEYSLRTKKLKRVITDEKRESEVLEYIQRHSQGLIQPEFCKRLFVQVISEGKRLQGEDLKLIGFQGEHGGFGEVAARHFDPSFLCISCDEYRELFEAVDSGLLQYGVVPSENTLGETVPDVNEFLVDRDLRICGEVRLPIHYFLLALPETDPKEIRVAFSSRSILSQCQNYLGGRNLEGRPYFDAAAAAKMLLRERPKGSAVIASRFAAEFYNLAILDQDVEDHHNNVTRFLIISKTDGGQGGNKCSIAFSAEDRAGALFRVLKAFADQEINLTRIESVLNRDDPGNYLFFVDFNGSTQDERVLRALERVRDMVPLYRFLGCYPEAKITTER